MAVDEFNPKHGQMVAFAFKIANATTQETNTDLSQDGGNTLIVMPKAGSVVGLGARASGAITAGTLTLKPHKNSTAYADVGVPAPVLSSTAQVSYASVRPKALTFVAGDVVGVEVTTTTTLDPTNTIDVDAQLYVIFND